LEIRLTNTSAFCIAGRRPSRQLLHRVDPDEVFDMSEYSAPVE